MEITAILANEFNLKAWQCEAVVKLHDEGCTVPFIARYRKEAHGSLDDQTIHNLLERLEYLRNFEARREEIRTAISELGQMTDEIGASLDAAKILSELEDIYRPFRQKRRTRATVAKEKGLEPLADFIAAQQNNSNPFLEAEKYIDAEKGVETAEDALQGASDILAERVSDNADVRRRLRNLYLVTGLVRVKAANDEKDSVYTAYYDYSESVEKIPDHRILAIDRGEKEEFLKVSVSIDEEKACRVAESETVTNPRSP